MDKLECMPWCIAHLIKMSDKLSHKVENNLAIAWLVLCDKSHQSKKGINHKIHIIFPTQLISIVTIILMWTLRSPRTTTPPPRNVNGEEVEQIINVKLLGLHLTKDMTWTVNTSQLVKKVQQRAKFFFLRKFKKANLPTRLLVNFYRLGTDSQGCTKGYGYTKLPELDPVYANLLCKSNIIKYLHPPWSQILCPPLQPPLLPCHYTTCTHPAHIALWTVTFSPILLLYKLLNALHHRRQTINMSPTALHCVFIAVLLSLHQLCLFPANT